MEQVVTEQRDSGAAEHMVMPKMVYISNPTELGTLYTLGELEAISSVCRQYGLYLFLDGARLGYGLEAKDNDVTLSDLARLCDVLALKSCVGADMYKAYQAGDRESLHIIANETLPEILNRLDAFRSAVEVRWLAEYKVSGFDVIDFRLGGVCARVQSASRRINAYLNGHIDSIPELEEPRLPFHCVSEEELEKERVICWNIRKDQYTANNI